jgi:hypothetical protein
LEASQVSRISTRRRVFRDPRFHRRRNDINGKLDMDKIVRGLDAERRGKVAAAGGYFGALQLLADIEARFRVPSGGGRPTDTSWTERRFVPPEART